MKAVIVAAGMGSRLWEKTNQVPKTLMPFGKGTILSTILKNISKTGIQEFVIVIGYKKEYLLNYLNEKNNLGFNIQCVENPEWQRGNGISVLAAEEIVGSEAFILSMSDHIISGNALQRIVNHQSSKNLLLVDPKVNEIFDIDDATKVKVEKNQIVDIGKQINDYNCIDCGIFRLNQFFFHSMREQLKHQKDSISAAIIGLIQKKDMEAVRIEQNDYWIDIDTPEAYHHALNHKILSKI
jgi:choline kinase